METKFFESKPQKIQISSKRNPKSSSKWNSKNSSKKKSKNSSNARKDEVLIPEIKNCQLLFSPAKLHTSHKADF